MTFLEKLKEDNPNLTEEEINKRVLRSCPYVYGYGGETENSKCMNDGKAGSHCIDCWNREIPNTELENVKEAFSKIGKAISKANEDVYKEDMNTAYNKGLNDAWELAKSCWNMSISDTREIFGYEYVKDILDNLTPQEALAKLKAYEDSKNRVQVGDVIKTPVGNAVVTYVREEEYIAITTSGAYVRVEGFVAKTGNHIDIQSILEQIG